MTGDYTPLNTPPLGMVAYMPISTEIRMADGVFMKTLRIEKAGTYVPQHAHSFDHVSVLVRGSVRLTASIGTTTDTRVYRAPTAITIPARVKHLFEALEDDTIVLCVHDIGTAEGVSIEEEHHLVEPDSLGG